MFPLAKLAELGPRTRLRKAARILQAAEGSLGAGRGCDRAYLAALVPLAEEALRSAGPPAGAAEELSTAGELAACLARSGGDAELLRAVNGLRHRLLAAVGAEPAEWDLVSHDDGSLDRSTVRLFPVAVYLEDLRSPFNVGSIIRTAEALGAERVLLSPRTPLPTHPRARRTARGAEGALPWEVRELGQLAGEPALFALELGGLDIGTFRFPRRGLVLVGSEELGLSPEALRLADAGLGRVSIPLAGAKRSLNVAVAFGILMQRWHEVLTRGD